VTNGQPEKLTINYLSVMEFEGSLPYLKMPVTSPYPEPD
jgi:hypothetical protein